MRRLYANGYDVADNLLAAFVHLGYWPNSSTTILDYGCGTGALVYRFRDLGLNAHGFDIHDRVVYRSDEDRKSFGFCSNPAATATWDGRVSREHFRLPFPANAFDIVVSTSVIEHIIDLDVVMAELARVLKRRGFSLHVYPKRSMLIEPHMYVPLATRFKSWWFFYFWAALGLRNEYTEAHQMTAAKTADLYTEYSRIGVAYRTQKQLAEICGQHFQQVKFVDDALHYNARQRDVWRSRLAALRAPYPMRALSVTQRTSALYTAFKIMR
jgi:SAM-dependent methyltransferase